MLAQVKNSEQLHPAMHHDDDHENHELAIYIGLSLIIGFAGMLVLDQAFAIIKECKTKCTKASLKNKEGSNLLDGRMSLNSSPNKDPQSKGESMRNNEKDDAKRPLLEKDKHNEDEIVESSLITGEYSNAAINTAKKHEEEEALIDNEKQGSARNSEGSLDNLVKSGDDKTDKVVVKTIK